MIFEGPIDLIAVDGRVARAQQAAFRELARLGTKEGRAEARSRDPFEGVRDVAGQSMFDGLRELTPGPVQEPHRDALSRWVHELLQQRVGWELVVDEADAIHAPDPKLATRALEAEESAIAKSFDEARRALVSAVTPGAADLAFERLVALSGPIADLRKEERARRFEAARRLGIDHPWALATAKGTSNSELDALARQVLDATEPLACELHKDLRRRSGAGVSGPALAIHDGFARDAREGWPARLSVRWLEEVFRAVAPRPPRITTLPPALGGASFVRAAAEWGAALRLGGVARTLPFALARDPYPIEARLFGCAFAIAVADRAFARRKLGLPSRSADAHARVLARTLFTELRITAGELVSGWSETVREDALEELTARLFGAPLPGRLAAAWSFGGFSGSARVDAPARLVAAVRAHGFVRSLVDRFDEDWFDNPRAGAHLASIGTGPVWNGDLPDAASVPAVTRAFEEMLG